MLQKKDNKSVYHYHSKM